MESKHSNKINEKCHYYILSCYLVAGQIGQFSGPNLVHGPPVEVHCHMVLLQTNGLMLIKTNEKTRTQVKVRPKCPFLHSEVTESLIKSKFEIFTKASHYFLASKCELCLPEYVCTRPCPCVCFAACVGSATLLAATLPTKPSDTHSHLGHSALKHTQTTHTARLP